MNNSSGYGPASAVELELPPECRTSDYGFAADRQGWQYGKVRIYVLRISHLEPYQRTVLHFNFEA